MLGDFSLSKLLPGCCRVLLSRSLRQALPQSSFPPRELSSCVAGQRGRGGLGTGCTCRLVTEVTPCNLAKSHSLRAVQKVVALLPDHLELSYQSVIPQRQPQICEFSCCLFLNRQVCLSLCWPAGGYPWLHSYFTGILWLEKIVI